MIDANICRAFIPLLVLGVARTTSSSPVAQNDFDLLIFTQNWPQTLCYTWTENSSEFECELPANERWTIHGLWPTIYGIIGPIDCNSSWPLELSALQPLENELQDKWNIKKDIKVNPLWTHEWEKHGTCATVLEPLNTELKYFQQTLKLFDRYNVKEILAGANIRSGENFKAQRLLDVIAKALGKRAQIVCILNSKTREWYLYEVQMCFDKQLNLVDCDGIYEYPSNCSANDDVVYPETVPN